MPCCNLSVLPEEVAIRLPTVNSQVSIPWSLAFVGVLVGSLPCTASWCYRGWVLGGVLPMYFVQLIWTNIHRRRSCGRHIKKRMLTRVVHHGQGRCVTSPTSPASPSLSEVFLPCLPRVQLCQTSDASVNVNSSAECHLASPRVSFSEELVMV